MGRWPGYAVQGSIQIVKQKMRILYRDAFTYFRVLIQAAWILIFEIIFVSDSFYVFQMPVFFPFYARDLNSGCGRCAALTQSN